MNTESVQKWVDEYFKGENGKYPHGFEIMRINDFSSYMAQKVCEQFGSEKDVKKDCKACMSGNSKIYWQKMEKGCCNSSCDGE